MGWLWSTPDPQPGSNKAEIPPSLPPKAIQEPAAASHSTTSPSKPLTRDEEAEQEFHSFLQELEADARPSSTKYSRIPRQPPPPTSTDLSRTSNADLEPLSEQLLPRTMSCRTAFDAAFYCQSMGGKFNDLYRYGTIKPCSDHWGDFWFCMRTRSYAPEEKQKMIRKHYREKERKKYGRQVGQEVGRSSEDVWSSRDAKLSFGEAFNLPVPEWVGTDEEWNRMERERRAAQREGRSV